MRLAALLAIAAQLTLAYADSRPNVVFLIVESTDGRLFKPSSLLPLPNIRSLLARRGGVLFNNTYSNSPMCLPSRSSLISGRNVHEIPHTHSFGPGPNDNVIFVPGAINNQEGLALDDNATLDVMMGAVGYATNVLGKTDWRVGGHIIDCALVPATMNVAWPYSINKTGGWADEPGGAYGCLYPGAVDAGGSGGPANSSHKDDWTVLSQGTAWISKQEAQRRASTDGGSPWLAYQGFNIVHPPYRTNQYWFDRMPETDAPVWTPLTDLHPCDFQASMKKGCIPSDDYPAKDTFYSATQKQYLRKIYLATIAEFDEMVGAYVKAVEAAGALNNTIFIITSDHGDMQMAHQQFYKMSPYEGSARVPLLIAGAGPSNGAVSVVDQPTQLLDIFPTLLTIAGAPIPSYAAGFALQPFLAGAATDANRSNFVISQFHGESSSMSWFAIIQGGYKLVVYGTGEQVPDQLFDLNADPGEGTNIALTSPAVTAAMKATLSLSMDYKGFAMQVAQYGKDVMHAWSNATVGGWRKGIADTKLSWNVAFAAAPNAATRAVADWLAAPLFIQGCVGNLTTGPFAAAATGDAEHYSLPPCSLNGVMNASGDCVCLPGWMGLTCNELRLLPAAPFTSTSQSYFHPANVKTTGFIDNSWGISVLKDDKNANLWHGFMTELEGNCSLTEYSVASRVLHVTATTPAGPWTFESVALSAFAHNPQAVRDIDGAWLLFHIGAPQPSTCNPVCKGNVAPNTTGCNKSSHGTSVARSMSPYGPWERVPYILPNNETNPSAVVLPNGTIMVTARRWVGGVPIYMASSWRGPYVQFPFVPVLPVGTGNPNAFDEDPFLYHNSLGWHMLTHREQAPDAGTCSATNPKTDCRCQGGHMYAIDPIVGPWYYDLNPVYNCSLEVEGSNTTLRLWARQRPTLIMSAPDSHCPILFNGASTDPVSQYYSSFTMYQRIDC